MLLNKTMYLPFLLCLGVSAQVNREIPPTVDLRTLAPDQGVIRIYGTGSSGVYGVPVAGGYDLNGDGFEDFAYADMTTEAFPPGYARAFLGGGRVNVIFGNGSFGVQESFVGDTSDSLVNFTVHGAQPYEMAGSEIWMGDLTGDGLGDLIIARQNFSPDEDRVGAGAITIIPGSPELHAFAQASQRTASMEIVPDPFSLGAPPEGIEVFTISGEAGLDRLGIWMRVGDITDDGIDDLAVGADQANTKGELSGKVYVIRGGRHLQTTAQVDLANLAGTILDGHVLTVLPPDNADGFHFGATLNVADLDNNGRAELMAAATLNRAGANLGPTRESFESGSAEAVGGSPLGRLFIVWDELFQGDWATDEIIDLAQDLETVTDIQGADTDLFTNNFFGEEILGGLDYNQDGEADLFIGDISGNTSEYFGAGVGFVFFTAQTLKGVKTDVASLLEEIEASVILGVADGTISADTAMHGDIDNDGSADLAISSPHASPRGRLNAGTLHILWGQMDWPDVIDLQEGSSITETGFQLTNIIGGDGDSFVRLRSGGVISDIGDTLAYSGASGDIDGDGYIDIITNEMVGNNNGLAPDDNRIPIDRGNLLILSGRALAEFK